MKQYIDKAALVAEIDELDELNIFLDTTNKYNEDYKCGYEDALERVREFIDTFEVKEVDLEKDVDAILETNDWNYDKIDFYEFAKHFFELGLEIQKGETELSKVKGFLVRDKDDYTAIYAEKPHRGKTEWVDGNDSCLMTINDARLVPDIEFEEEPVEVEVVIKAQKGE